MNQTIKTKTMKIGDSLAVIVPRFIVEQLKLADGVEMTVEDDHLELHPWRKPREGWAEAFQEMARRGDDQLLD